MSSPKIGSRVLERWLRLWRALRVTPWPVRMFTVGCIIGCFVGFSALISKLLILNLRPELVVGPGRGGFLDRLSFALGYGFGFYIIGSFVGANHAREPKLKNRYVVVGWTLVWILISLATGLNPDTANPFRFHSNPYYLIWSVLIPLALGVLWLLPSVREHAHTKKSVQQLDIARHFS